MAALPARPPLPAMAPADRGFTVFELLVAVVLLAMVSTMIYSVLHTAIRFTDQGDQRILAMERRHGLAYLLFQQINSAWLDPHTKNVIISGDGENLRLVTCYPLFYRDAGVVLAYYRYDGASRRLYYTEKRDYYNVDYDEEYLPEFDDMFLLAEDMSAVSLQVDDESKVAAIQVGETSLEIVPRCAPPGLGGEQ